MAYRYKQITKLSETYPNERIYAIYKKHEGDFTTTVPDERLDAALKDNDYTLMVWRYDEDPSWYEGIDKYGILRKMKYGSQQSNELKAIKELWDAFGEVPIDNNDKILERFCKFPKGTSRFEVWTWFEEEFNVSVGMDLMGLEGSEV